MSKIGNIAVGISIVVSSLVLAGCGSSNPYSASTTGAYTSSKGVKTVSRSVNYLATNSDFTLYRFSKDLKDSNMSNCNGGCAVAWPPYNAGVLTSLDTANGLSNFTRADGTQQTAYFGYPLYKFQNDINVGDTNGNFVHDAWNLDYPKKFDTNGAGAKLSLSKVDEKYMVDDKGLSLYTFADDNVTNVSSCYDVVGKVPCATIWPPFYENVTATNISNDLNISLFGTVQRTDGKKQISYNGKPLYHFAGIAAKNIAGDTKTGDTNGDWFKSGDWHLVQIKKSTMNTGGY